MDYIKIILAIVLLVLYFVFRNKHIKTGQKIYETLRYITAGVIVVMAIISLLT